jgi:hypothetical protein
LAFKGAVWSQTVSLEIFHCRPSLLVCHAANVDENIEYDDDKAGNKNPSQMNPNCGTPELQLSRMRYFGNPQARPNKAPDHTKMYDVSESYYNRTAPYWLAKLRVERFPRFEQEALFVSPLLYRPNIVNDIVRKVEYNLRDTFPVGLLVTGPQGIGKSYSLVSAVVKLESSGNYLVTLFRTSMNGIKNTIW